MIFGNAALWRKTAGEALLLLVPMCAVVAGFSALFVYLMSMIQRPDIPEFIKRLLPKEMLKLNSIPLEKLTTMQGLLTVLYGHPVPLFTCYVWALVRGSAAVSGEITRGTMEVLLAQPISRTSVIVAQGVTAVLGAGALALSVVGGLALGVATVRLDEAVDVASFWPATLNLFLFIASLCAVSTLVSAVDNYRWRTLGVLGLFAVTQIILDVTVRLVPEGHFLRNLRYLTLVTAYEPQFLTFVSEAERGRWAAGYAAVYAAVIVLGYGAAVAVFRKRDLPTPL